MRSDLAQTDHISYSQIQKFRLCPRNWEFCYVKGLWGPSTPNLLVGSVYHSCVEFGFKFKLEHHNEDLDPEFFERLVEKEWYTATKDKFIDWQDKDPDDLKAQVMVLVSTYLETVAPTITPVSVEREYRKPIGETGSVFILRVDLIDDNNTVYDHKTSNRAYNQGDVDKDSQATATAWVLDCPIEFHNHVALKIAKPKIQIIKTNRTQEDIDWFDQSVVQHLAMMRSGIYPPNEDSWACNPLYCNNYQLCRGTIHRVYITKEGE